MTSPTDLEHGDTRLLIRECEKQYLLRNQTAYVLATAWHETGRTMKPVREAFGETDQQTIARMERAWAKGVLTWVSKPYWRPDENGRAWFGRGYVQLTHEYNYDKAGRALDLPLVKDPSLAMEPRVAAAICVRGMKNGWFTSHKLNDYITLVESDFLNARRIVNGMDRASKIAAYAEVYDDLLLDAGYGVDPEPEGMEPEGMEPAASVSLHDALAAAREVVARLEEMARHMGDQA